MLQNLIYISENKIHTHIFYIIIKKFTDDIIILYKNKFINFIYKKRKTRYARYIHTRTLGMMSFGETFWLVPFTILLFRSAVSSTWDCTLTNIKSWCSASVSHSWNSRGFPPPSTGAAEPPKIEVPQSNLTRDTEPTSPKLLDSNSNSNSNLVLISTLVLTLNPNSKFKSWF